MIALVLSSFLAHAASVSASSELKDPKDVKNRHTADQAFDGLLTTGWAEGDPTGPGNGAWLQIKLDKPTEIREISVWPGNLAEGTKSIKECGRPKDVTITLTTAKGDVVQKVRMLDGAGSDSVDGALPPGVQRIDVMLVDEDKHPLPVTATAIKLTVDDAFAGIVFDDTYISEVALNFTTGVVPPQVDTAKKYEDSPQAKLLGDKNKEQIVKLYDEIKAEQFGDRDKLHQIMDQAGEGAPFMRQRAAAEIGRAHV